MAQFQISFAKVLRLAETGLSSSDINSIVWFDQELLETAIRQLRDYWLAERNTQSTNLDRIAQESTDFSNLIFAIIVPGFIIIAVLNALFIRWLQRLTAKAANAQQSANAMFEMLPNAVFSFEKQLQISRHNQPMQRLADHYNCSATELCDALMRAIVTGSSLLNRADGKQYHRLR